MKSYSSIILINILLLVLDICKISTYFSLYIIKLVFFLLNISFTCQQSLIKTRFLFIYSVKIYFTLNLVNLTLCNVVLYILLQYLFSHIFIYFVCIHFIWPVTLCSFFSLCKILCHNLFYFLLIATNPRNFYTRPHNLVVFIFISLWIFYCILFRILNLLLSKLPHLFSNIYFFIFFYSSECNVFKYYTVNCPCSLLEMQICTATLGLNLLVKLFSIIYAYILPPTK